MEAVLGTTAVRISMPAFTTHIQPLQQGLARWLVWKLHSILTIYFGLGAKETRFLVHGRLLSLSL